MKIKSEYIYRILIIALLLGITSVLNAESLWPAGRTRSAVGDKVAVQRGDLVTIIISESTTMSTSLSANSENKSNINNTVTQILFPVTESGFGTHNGVLPATNITGENKAERGGSITNSTSLTDKITIMVSDVLPNGNLVLMGTRRVEHSGEVVDVIVSGICRSWDVSSANTIASEKIHNFGLQYVFEGELTEGQKKGWLQKFYDKIKPF